MTRSIIPMLFAMALASGGCVLVTDSRTMVDEDMGSTDGDPQADDEDTDGASTGGDGDSGDTGDDSGGSPSEPKTGEELYLICAGCHGPTGEGTELGFELRHPDRDYSTWVVRNGRPPGTIEGSTMVAYGENVISDEDLEKIWDYLDSFEQPTTSEGLYFDYCGNCHGPSAAGGPTGVDIHEKTLPDTIERVRDGEAGTSYDLRARFMPAFDTTRVTDEELQLIVDYWLNL